LLQASLRTVGALELGREKANVLLCAGQLSVGSQNISVLYVELVQRCELPVRGGGLVTVLEVGDLPED
jgi:glucose-6-phosphate dehydrogenase assembly protein OpcA